MQALIEARYPQSTYSYGELKELILDSGKIKQITKDDKKFVEFTFKELTSLSCSRTGLASLENFPVLPNLQKLELQDNALSSGLNILKEATPVIRILRVGGNRLTSLEQLINDLKGLELLKTLDIELNPLCREGTVKKIFNGLPNLKVVNSLDINGNEVDEDDDEEEEEEEENEEEDEEDEDGVNNLKEFYEKDYSADDDDDDADTEDFNLLNFQEDDDEGENEDDEGEEEEEEEEKIESNDSTTEDSRVKRPADEFEETKVDGKKLKTI